MAALILKGNSQRSKFNLDVLNNIVEISPSPGSLVKTVEDLGVSCNLQCRE